MGARRKPISIVGDAPRPRGPAYEAAWNFFWYTRNTAPPGPRGEELLRLVDAFFKEHERLWSDYQRLAIDAEYLAERVEKALDTQVLRKGIAKARAAMIPTQEAADAP